MTNNDIIAIIEKLPGTHDSKQTISNITDKGILKPLKVAN